MAVAADSHCDFLIPEQYRHAVRPTTEISPMSCVYSFVGDIISQKAIFVKGFFEITEENGAVFITAPYYYL